MDFQRPVIRLLLFSLVMLAVVGCSHDDSGMTTQQQQTAANVSAWAKRTDGHWDKLTPDEQRQMIQSVGSESSAKKVLEMKAHKPAPIAPGPPAGWHPGGPPPH